MLKQTMWRVYRRTRKDEDYASTESGSRVVFSVAGVHVFTTDLVLFFLFFFDIYICYYRCFGLSSL